MLRRAGPWPAIAIALATVPSCGSGELETFIPMQRDFANFREWMAFDLGDITIGGHPPGHQTAYVNYPLEPGERAYRVGTIIVRVIDSGSRPQDWDIFAMAKRGGDYNAAGAVGWEFFILRINADGIPVILGRGLAPTSNQLDPYHQGPGITCNSCHGSPDARTTDSILSPVLQPPH